MLNRARESSSGAAVRNPTLGRVRPATADGPVRREPSAAAPLNEAVLPAYDRIKFLDGRSVLVRPEIFDSQNSVGMRGTVHVVPDPTHPGGYRVEIALGYPEMSDMAGEHGHEERLPLSPAEVEELLLSEYRGTYTFTQHKAEGPTRTAG